MNDQTGRAGVWEPSPDQKKLSGRHEFLIDPADPLSAGFLLR